MKKLITYTMTALFVSTLALVGTVNAGWFQSDAVAAQQDAAAEQAMPAGKQLILSGMINDNSQFVDEKGDIFNLANNDKGMEVKVMNGMKVEIKGTVMEQEGEKVVEIIEYNILK